MDASVRFKAPHRAVQALALASLASGMAGMAASYLYLAAVDPRDVIAGAAGFIAGSVLVGAGLVSLSLERYLLGLARHGADLLSLEPARGNLLRVEHWL